MTHQFNLADLFEIVVDTVPDRTALIAGDVTLTYAELDARANRLAHHLLDAGIGPGDHVGVLAHNRAEWIEAFFATAKIRAVCVNLNYRYVADELRYVIENGDCVALIFEDGLAGNITPVLPDLPRLRHLIVLDGGYPQAASTTAVAYEDALAAASPRRGFAERSADDLYLLYTGGTTGLPKGVMWRQEDIFFAAMGGGDFNAPIATPDELADRVRARPEYSYLCPAPMMHGGGQWVSSITFFGGGTLILYTSHTFDAAEMWTLVDRHHPLGLMFVGDAMARPLAETLAANPGRWDTSSLFTVGSGGGMLSPVIKEQLRALIPNALVMDSFGASETGAGGSVMDIGGPAAGARFTVGPQLDVLGDDLRPVAPGSDVMGRLARRGHIPIGYYKDPEKTAATFIVDPDGVRWVVPGDFARKEPDGTVTVLGRGSGCINTGGEKVFPEEVEEILKHHPAVFDVLVVGVPDERFVERVAAVVAPRPGMRPTLAELDAHCRTTLAAYKIPRQLTVVDEIARTPVGKPDYRWANAIARKEHQREETQ
jgi:3-oxocholest-4-en-26-oate---CoA ligase